MLGVGVVVLIHWVSSGKKIVSEEYAKAGGLASETLSAIRTVQSLTGELHVLKRFDHYLAAAEKAGIKATTFVGLGNGMLFCAAFLLYALGFYYGSSLVADDLPKVLRGEDGPGVVTGGTIITSFFAFLMVSGCVKGGEMRKGK